MTRLIQAKQIAIGVVPFYANSSIPGGNTIANTAVETAFSSSFIIPPNSLKVGDFFKIYLRGVYGSTLPLPSLRIKIKIGSTTIIDTGALSTLLGSTSSGWGIDANVLCLGLPTTTTPFDAQGNGYVQSSANLTATPIVLANGATFPIDCTVAQTVTCTVTWSAANAANTITLRQFLVRKD